MKYLNRIRNTSLEVEELLLAAAEVLKKEPENIRKSDLTNVRKMMTQVNYALGWIADSIKLKTETAVASYIKEKMIVKDGVQLCFDAAHFYVDLEISKHAFEASVISLQSKGLMYSTAYTVFKDEMCLGYRRVLSYKPIEFSREFNHEDRSYRQSRRKRVRDLSVKDMIEQETHGRNTVIFNKRAGR